MSSTHKAGSCLVIALLLGAVGGTISVAYWLSMAKPEQESVSAGGWDQQKADEELTNLKKTFDNLIGTRTKGKLGSVLDAARDFVRRYPEHAEGHVHLGLVLIQQDQPKAAYDALASGLQLHQKQPQFPNELLLKLHKMAGILATNADRHDDAARHYRRLIDLDPSSAANHLFLADLYFDQKRYEDARLLLLKALRIDSNLHKAHVLLSDIFAEQGQPIAALTQIQHAIDKAGPFSERDQLVKYIRKKAKLLRRTNQPIDALLILQELRPAEQTFEVLQEMAICWAMTGEPAKGAALFEQALVHSPMDWRVIAAAADWQIKAGNLKPAQKHVDMLRRLNPNLPVIDELQKRIKAMTAAADPRGAVAPVPASEGTILGENPAFR